MTFLGSFTNTHLAYLKAVRTLLEEGDVVSPRNHDTRELINVTWTLTDPTQDQIYFNRTCCPQRQPIYESYAKREMEWYQTGNLSAESAPATFWKTLADGQGNIVSNYGHITLFDKKYPGRLSGVEHVVNLLETDPTTRQAVLHYNQPKHYFSGNKDVPCTMFNQFMIRRNRLSMLAVMRSCDIFLGFPYDVIWFCWLMQLVQSKLSGCRLGEFTFTIGSLHLYERDLENARLIASV